MTTVQQRTRAGSYLEHMALFHPLPWQHSQYHPFARQEVLLRQASALSGGHGLHPEARLALATLHHVVVFSAARGGCEQLSHEES